MTSEKKLKHMKHLFVAVSLLAMMAGTGKTHAQKAEPEDLRKAFASSYTDEYNKDYAKAIGDLKNVFSEKSYEINLRLGWLHYENLLYTESMNYYRTAMKLMPYSVEAKFGYVYPAAALGNWEDVIKTYQDILAIDSQNTTVLYRLGLIYYSRKEYTNADKYFEKLVNLYPFGYDGVINLAYSKLNLNKPEEAKMLFNKALLIYPNDTVASKGLKQIK
jgi:tetratricopeptide (TPR) repeat protein